MKLPHGQIRHAGAYLESDHQILDLGLHKAAAGDSEPEPTKLKAVAERIDVIDLQLPAVCNTQVQLVDGTQFGEVLLEEPRHVWNVFAPERQLHFSQLEQAGECVNNGLPGPLLHFKLVSLDFEALEFTVVANKLPDLLGLVLPLLFKRQH